MGCTCIIMILWSGMAGSGTVYSKDESISHNLWVCRLGKVTTTVKRAAGKLLFECEMAIFGIISCKYFES